VRVASEHRRLARNRFERVGGDEDAASRASAAPDGPLEARDLVERGLSGLDIDKRAVFVMHHLDEQTIPDVARALGIPEGTAYSRLRAAREAFTATIRRIQRGEP
jgi:RNA polymerase sigma-70 factor (ECF subfamily)